ncbi:regulator of chromosome condensation 1/beta-lactamase-inhibitor protein II [Astrocystis sublimbata]|nr:regulator of chromosome condensation 1/beta-lactamase-inhibitor protein II [Astrocystis sublimbata]
MNLYATGFNAWRQLEFSLPHDTDIQPDDLTTFQKVLSDELIEPQHASLACTVVNTSAGLRCAGYATENGIEPEVLSPTSAVAANGTVAVYNGLDSILQYKSLAEMETSHIFSGMYEIVQLVAYETGFVALSRDGDVWSWGDERYSATLGRDITPTSPADRPGLVEDLRDLPSGKIRKIAAGGYTVLALTEGHDLYGWGGHPARQPITSMLSSSPSPVDVEDHDLLDCSVGETHMIVLTTGGKVYVIGENSNGQLGVPSKRAYGWTEVSLSARGEAIVGVKAGQRSSFIVTKNARLS